MADETLKWRGHEIPCVEAGYYQLSTPGFFIVAWAAVEGMSHAQLAVEGVPHVSAQAKGTLVDALELAATQLAEKLDAIEQGRAALLGAAEQAQLKGHEVFVERGPERDEWLRQTEQAGRTPCERGRAGGRRPCFTDRSVCGAAQQNLPPMCGPCSGLWLALYRPTTGPAEVDAPRALELLRTIYKNASRHVHDFHGGHATEAIKALGGAP